MGKHHKHKKSSDKWMKITTSTTPKKNTISAPNSPKRHKKKRHKGIGLGKIAKGVVKRGDSVGKFTGGIIKQQSNAIASVTKAFSNPIVIFGIAGVALVILLRGR